MLFMLKGDGGFECFYLKKLTGLWLSCLWGSVFFNRWTEQFYSSKKKLSLAV
jgi:hypothetical protein